MVARGHGREAHLMGGAPGIALMDTGHSYAGFTPYLTPQGNRSPSRGSFSRTRSRENVNRCAEDRWEVPTAQWVSYCILCDMVYGCGSRRSHVTGWSVREEQHVRYGETRGGVCILQHCKGTAKRQSRSRCPQSSLHFACLLNDVRSEKARCVAVMSL